MAWRTVRSWTPGLNFASGQFRLLQRLNASCVNDGDEAFTALMFLALASLANAADWTFGTMSTSPSVSARSTASAVPYLIHWISSNFGLGPRKYRLRVIRMM